MTDTMASSTVAAATATAAANSAPSTAANTADPAATRGVPYYEKLRKELRETLQKKRLLDKNLVRQDRPFICIHNPSTLHQSIKQPGLQFLALQN